MGRKKFFHTFSTVYKVSCQVSKIKQPIGNIYDFNWETALRDRLYINDTCHCYIGYVHLDYLQLDKVFGERILERIPVVTLGKS